MKYFFIVGMLLLSLLLEGSLFSLPLVLVTILLLAVLFRQLWIFLAAFVMGVLLDSVTLHALGTSSLFFLMTLCVVFLYQRKYEIQSVPFVGIFTTLASFVYVLIVGSSFPFLEAIVSGVLASGIFFLFIH